MSTIVTRAGKGSPLTHTEVDNNFTNLNIDKYQSGDSASFSSITNTGNLTFTGTGNRITGDFSNGTIASRVAFQTSTTDGNTGIFALPNGTATTSTFSLSANSDPTNTSILQLNQSSASSSLRAAITGTGTYVPLLIFTGGSERLRIDTSGNVLVGTSGNPSAARLFVAGGNLAVGTAAAPEFQVTSDGTNGYIDARLTGGGLIFRTNGSSERMRIDSSGNVGIGTSSPGVRLDVSASQPTRGVIAILTNSFSATKTGSQMVFSQAGLDNWAIGMPGGSSSAFVLWNGRSSSGDGTEFLRVNDVGNLVLRGGTTTASGVGITFPATQSASSDANTLDDYEEGTFTPTVTNGITSPTYARQVGTYTKIGNLVHFQISIETNGGTRNSGGLRIGSLPFTQADFNGGVGYTVAYVSNVVNSTTTNIPTLYGDGLQTHMSFYKTDSATFTGNDLQSASFRIDITGNYRV